MSRHVPTKSTNRQNLQVSQDTDIFSLVKNNCADYDPVLLFLIGYNYCKFEQTYQDQSFFDLAQVIQKGISKRQLSDSQIIDTYSKLYSQTSLEQIFKLDWLKSKRIAMLMKDKQNMNVLVPDNEEIKRDFWRNVGATRGLAYPNIDNLSHILPVEGIEEWK